MVNLFANDAQRIFDLCVFGPLIIGGPVIALGGVIYIGLLLGPYALFGMVAFVLFYPLQVGRRSFCCLRLCLSFSRYMPFKTNTYI